MPLNVTSEVGKLRKVLLHRPSFELENLIPDYLDRLLFDDIPYLKIAQEEHDHFADVLRKNGCKVFYLHELVANVIKDNFIKEKFINQFIEESDVRSSDYKKLIYDFLYSIKNEEDLVLKTMGGINKNDLNIPNKGSLSDYVQDDYSFLSDPMPNLYFTRDPFASIGKGVSINRMYSITRNRETIYGDYIFKYHEDFKDVERYYDRYSKHHIEGGDILNIGEKVIAVGISQRTEPSAIEKLAQNIFFNTKENKIETILAINIPKTRAYMHLDTVFTQVDIDKFTILSQIEESIEVFKITRGKDSTLKIERQEPSLRNILSKHLGEDIELIKCGGENCITAKREQWNDGANTLCINPGEVIVYSRNYVTNEILGKKGVKIHEIPSSELSRGRGGPRCMSMPLLRDNL